LLGSAQRLGALFLKYPMMFFHVLIVGHIFQAYFLTRIENSQAAMTLGHSAIKCASLKCLTVMLAVLLSQAPCLRKRNNIFFYLGKCIQF
jgi:hypothetical protein